MQISMEAAITVPSSEMGNSLLEFNICHVIFERL